MYPELQQFHKIKTEYESEIERLEERKKQLQEEKAEASRQYNKTLSKVVYEGDSDSAVELAERKKASTEIAEELKSVKEEVDHLKVTMDERLESMIASVKEGRDREFGAAEKQMQLKKEDLMRYRAEYLMLIQQLFDIRRYAQDVDTEFKKTIKPYTHEFDYETLTLPDVNLHNPYAAEDAVGILETEVQHVYKTGKLPNWVGEYTKE
ncbi:MAG TPA: hypothetical protein VFK37_00910 [Bacillales bacterium]|nr:hypothetical protein [Bacillales bacterium]